MNKSVEIKVLEKIKKAQRGAVFYCESFLLKGNAKTVNKALERLANAGELLRVATGLYVRPQNDPVIGPVKPGIDAIAKAIAKRDRARIVPAGDYALNRLGLSTQVPLNVIYLTDGAPRTIKIGKRSIIFRKTTPKNVAAIGEISRLVIQALRVIGKDNVTTAQTAAIKELLKKEKPSHLQHDIRMAPEWIRRIMQSVLKKEAEGYLNDTGVGKAV